MVNILHVDDTGRLPVKEEHVALFDESFKMIWAWIMLYGTCIGMGAPADSLFVITLNTLTWH